MKYIVTVTINVEADDEDEAMDKASDLVEKGTKNFDVQEVTEDES